MTGVSESEDAKFNCPGAFYLNETFEVLGRSLLCD